jgi:DnaJ-class molecular chaperone
MNITKSYKTLDLKTGASIDDVRKAYKDMVRVWHPDRFAGNMRLRAKANEKLKEINLAYSEIQKFWAKDCRAIHSDTEKSDAQKKRALMLITKPDFSSEKFLDSHFRSSIR